MDEDCSESEQATTHEKLTRGFHCSYFIALKSFEKGLSDAYESLTICSNHVLSGWSISSGWKVTFLEKQSVREQLQYASCWSFQKFPEIILCEWPHLIKMKISSSGRDWTENSLQQLQLLKSGHWINQIRKFIRGLLIYSESCSSAQDTNTPHQVLTDRNNTMRTVRVVFLLFAVLQGKVVTRHNSVFSGVVDAFTC